MPTASEETTAEAGTTSGVSGPGEADAAEQGVEPDGQADAADDADGGRDEADDDASISTEPTTWRRRAPSARSSASSRVRWATMIENVL